ncbi:MAG: TIGR03617 family F420-dependent LLM class oxidoreductase [Gammaproteobacteria bacterium]|nr:TIGR03617 family F420-dependent LLM class oxidoreductase [Gammaproteobacteria bacterium]MBP6052117.1 TIGR03617 family F420-dependent LLM class oxidoreductase [Pseudomonadales bacterium]MBK6582178.1 TIGR03617 family F420-dependent LLM class oxidoreductase [Gammaproteobacteria bacterium]MBK7170573.1 TIGR03617 family F420-dependent LLM class oxidoreductase [Gammaproteobacteria bacterium]MBK7521548.1 TIGR03617 family F420-dependent LLM class oxidoreductase [Gammaproteobacteria bacterium]
MFTVYASTPESMGPREIVAHAQRAEAMGFDGLQVPDAVHDGFLLAAMALNATVRLKVCIGVLVAFPRSPMNVALAAWDLQAMSDGRFELGLGTQVKGNIEGRYSTPWTSPVPRMREYIGALRAIFDTFQNGSKLDYVSENYRFTRMQPFFNPGPIEHPRIPLLMGAVGPVMTNLAGEVADGMITHPTNTPPRYIREVVLPRLREGAGRGGRELDGFNLLLCALVATGPDADSVRREREKWRKMLGFLYSTPAYWPSLELFGWQHKGEELLRMTRENRWDQMSAIIDDGMLDTFVPSATYATIPAVLRDWYGGLSGTITFMMPDDPAQDGAAAEAIHRLRTMA